jgi:hypothetical protein
MPLAVEKVITRNWGRPNSWTLDAYRGTGATPRWRRCWACSLPKSSTR